MQSGKKKSAAQEPKGLTICDNWMKKKKKKNIKNL